MWCALLRVVAVALHPPLRCGHHHRRCRRPLDGRERPFSCFSPSFFPSFRLAVSQGCYSTSPKSGSRSPWPRRVRQLSGSISTIWTILSWICARIYMCGRCLVLFALKVGRHRADLTFLRPFFVFRHVVYRLQPSCREQEASEAGATKAPGRDQDERSAESGVLALGDWV